MSCRAVERVLAAMWIKASRKGERRFWPEPVYELVEPLPKRRFRG
jgi:hypothetical protein